MISENLLIFDLDGTLFCTESVTVPAVEEMCLAAGVPCPSADMICRFFGKPAADFHRWIQTVLPVEFISLLDEREIELIKKRGRLYPGVRQVMEQMHLKGFTMIICSNGTPRYVHEVVSATHIQSCFEALLMPQIIADTKSSMIRNYLSMHRYERVFIIGDRVEDVQAGIDNGIPVIGVLYGYGRGNELAGAAAIIDSISELPDRIDSFCQQPIGI